MSRSQHGEQAEEDDRERDRVDEQVALDEESDQTFHRLALPVDHDGDPVAEREVTVPDHPFALVQSVEDLDPLPRAASRPHATTPRERFARPEST